MFWEKVKSVMIRPINFTVKMEYSEMVDKR